MENRVGILVKYKNVVKSLLKKYFFIDSDGILYFTSKESLINEILETDGIQIKDAIGIIQNQSKQIKLSTCSLSPSIKPYTEKNVPDLYNRSHIKIFEKSGNFRILILFAWREEKTSNLFNVITGGNQEIFTESTRNRSQSALKKSQILDKYNEESFEFFSELTCDTLFKKNDKSIEEIPIKLDGKYVHQRDWHKKTIKVTDSIKTHDNKNQISYEEFIILENNSKYSGPIKNGMPFGQGKEYRSDGYLYQGNFVDGKWHGEGTLTNMNLKSFKGEFINGCISGI